MVAGFFLLFGLCLTLGLNLQNASTRAALFSDPMNIALLFLGVLCAASLVVLGIVISYFTARRLEAPSVFSVTGPLRFERDYSPNSNITAYYMFVGKKRFSLGRDESRRFGTQAHYRFYYTKAGPIETILSYEKVDGE